jgi:hypothetical protein
VPFREKGIPTALQIENYQEEKNPAYHTPNDTVTMMNYDYWLEQMKGTIAVAAHLALLPAFEPEEYIYLPFLTLP